MVCSGRPHDAIGVLCWRLQLLEHCDSTQGIAVAPETRATALRACTVVLDPACVYTWPFRPSHYYGRHKCQLGTVHRSLRTPLHSPVHALPGWPDITANVGWSAAGVRLRAAVFVTLLQLVCSRQAGFTALAAGYSNQVLGARTC